LEAECYRSLGLVDDAFADGVKDELGGGVEAEFFEDVGAVSFDGVRGDVEVGGYFLVGFAFGEELEDFAFPGGEEIVGIDDALLAEHANVVFREQATDSGTEEGFALRDRVEGGKELRGSGILEEIAASAGIEGAHDVGFVGMHAEHDDAGGGRLFKDGLSGLNAVEERHGDVHNNDVGRQRGRKGDGVAAVIGFADDFEIGLALEESAEAGAHDGMIVCEKDAKFSHDGTP